MKKTNSLPFYLSEKSETAITGFLVWICCALTPAGWTAPTPITLETLLSNAMTKSGQVAEAQADVESARAQLGLARAALWPKAEGVFIAAPLFEERGNAVSSTVNYNNWGPFLKAGFQIIQPVYSFGMISSYNKAAENQVVARENLTEVRRQEVVMLAKEFYYGYQMARDLEALVADLVSYLDEAVKKADEQAKNNQKSGGSSKSEGVTPHDLFKLKTALEDLKQKLLLAKQSRMTAEKAVAWVTNTAIDSLPNYPLQPEAFQKLTLDQYLAMAKENRAEVKALTAGKEARAALRDAKRAQSYPLFFAGAYATQGWSPVRDKQQSFYAYDPFNRLEGGVGLGVRFDLEFAKHSAEAAEQEAELNKLRATESYALPGIELQVKKAYWELEQALDGLKIAEQRKALSKKWFYSNAMGWSIGVTPPKDLLESLEGDGLAKKNHIETIYAVNMALGRLTQAVGREVTALKYR